MPKKKSAENAFNIVKLVTYYATHKALLTKYTYTPQQVKIIWVKSNAVILVSVTLHLTYPFIPTADVIPYCSNFSGIWLHETHLQSSK